LLIGRGQFEDALAKLQLAEGYFRHTLLFLSERSVNVGSTVHTWACCHCLHSYSRAWHL